MSVSRLGISTDDSAAVSAAIQWAIERLREKYPESVKYDDLVSYCWSGHEDNSARITFWTFWTKNKHNKISYNPATNTYRFRPQYPIASGDDLVDYFRRQKTANALQVKDLKEGWPEAENDIDSMEKEHKVLVERNKKDGKPRLVWADDPELYAPLDQEFRDMWLKIALPSPEDTIKELARIGHRSAGQVKDAKKAVAATSMKKARKSRGFKQTNTHMAHLFKDFSGKRAQAGK
ncbi:hypothetical protein DV737_g2035, partial [Chaetothyriales sp. CBS 132003]